jgi:CubicO group peptidase (beta-lactamase class C family)
MTRPLGKVLIAIVLSALLPLGSLIGQVKKGVVGPTSTTRGQSKLTKQRDDARLREFETFVRLQMERDRIPGLTIGFLQDDATWVKSFGYADVENKTPATNNSAYRIASTTKTMTAAAIVQLAERGKINLDAEIQTYLPEYPKQKWPVTVRQLLTHLGGGQGPSGLGPEQVSMKELVARISATPITVEPGTRFIYGTADYNLLAAAIENITGSSFGKYLRENLWLPAGMNDTRIDDVRGLVANRVRGYDLADGELKNAPFINVSSRVGGGGVTSTVPDLLRWARAIIDRKVVSPKWHDEMLTPVTTSAGRWSGIGDADEYYTLGWMVRPVNGNFVINHGGSQKGTAAAFFVFPARRMAFTALANLEFADLDKYVSRLYETVTGEEWASRVATRDPIAAPIARALDSAFNYGSLEYWQHHRAMTNSIEELAEAFDYFNTNTNLEKLTSQGPATMKKIRDGRHPAGVNAFIKIGSFIAAKLIEKNGAASFSQYHRAGAIPFFADYVQLYKADVHFPAQFRFTSSFETMIGRWKGDWLRTWNEYSRSVELAAGPELPTIGARLKKEFAGAEVYPDFSNDLQRIQQGEFALISSKIGVDLYPSSDELLFNLGYFLLMAEQTEPGRAGARRAVGDYERPLVYFKRAFESNPNGVMAAPTFLDLGRRWLRRPEMHAAALEFVTDGIALHPKQGELYELLGDLLFRKGQTDQAINNFRMAYQLDPKLGKGTTLEEYIAARTKLN